MDWVVEEQSTILSFFYDLCVRNNGWSSCQDEMHFLLAAFRQSSNVFNPFHFVMY